MMSAKEAMLAEAHFFQLLDAEERAALAAVLEEVQLAAGAVVFEAGDPGDRMYVVCAGAVEITTTDKLGQPLVLTIAKHGDMFGELSLLDDGPRTARAVVVEPVDMLALSRDQLVEFIRRHPDAALDMMATMGRRIRATTDRLKQFATRNVNDVAGRKLTTIERITDWIAGFSGSFAFLMIHVVVFALWIGWNLLPGLVPFDPFPFGLLTMAVSLEAIFLSVIVLLSQSREAAKDRIRADVEYDVNLKAELEVTHLHEKLDRLHGAVLARLHRIEADLRR